MFSLQACLSALNPRGTARNKYRLNSSVEVLMREALSADNRSVRKEILEGAADIISTFCEREREEATHCGEWREEKGAHACVAAGQGEDGALACMHAGLLKSPHWTCCGKQNKDVHCSVAHVGEWRDIDAELRLPAGIHIESFCSSIKSSASEGTVCSHELGIIKESHWSCW